MSSGDIAISVRDLSKAYVIAHNAARHTTLAEALMHRVRRPFARATHETFWALRDLSLEIQKGEVVGVIGRNGAGKSTFLKILSRITEPTSGKVDLFGRVGSLLEVGTGFHPELTGRENIYLNGQILGMRKREIDRQFDAIVDFAGVEQFLDTPVKRYSSGMYVRLAFAVAAHLSSEILLVDEVLAVGDAEFQKKCLGKMGDVARGGRTVLFVSHEISTILRICSKCVLLDRGQKKMMGPAADVVNVYFRDIGGQSKVSTFDGAKRPDWVNGGARLVSARLSGPSNAGHWSVPFGEQLSFRVLVKVEQAASALELGIGLFSATNFEIASSVSSDALPCQSAQPGYYTFGVTYEDLRLAPGRYRLGLGIRSGRGFEDYLPDAIFVDVVASERGAGLPLSTMRGAVIPNVRYSLDQASDHDCAAVSGGSASLVPRPHLV